METFGLTSDRIEVGVSTGTGARSRTLMQQNLSFPLKRLHKFHSYNLTPPVRGKPTPRVTTVGQDEDDLGVMERGHHHGRPVTGPHRKYRPVLANLMSEVTDVYLSKEPQQKISSTIGLTTY